MSKLTQFSCKQHPEEHTLPIFSLDFGITGIQKIQLLTVSANQPISFQTFPKTQCRPLPSIPIPPINSKQPDSSKNPSSSSPFFFPLSQALYQSSMVLNLIYNNSSERKEMPEIQFHNNYPTASTFLKSRITQERRDPFSTPEKKTRPRNLSPGRKTMQMQERPEFQAFNEPEINGTRLFFF